MGAAKRLEEKVKLYGGQHAEEIILSVRELAEIDVMIKTALDEIESIDDKFVRKHNELADRINDLVRKVSDNNGDSGLNESQADPEPDDQNCDMMINVEIRVERQF